MHKYKLYKEAIKSSNTIIIVFIHIHFILMMLIKEMRYNKNNLGYKE